MQIIFSDEDKTNFASNRNGDTRIYRRIQTRSRRLSNISRQMMSSMPASNARYCSALPVGPATYQLIRNLLAPAKPTDKTLKQIVDAVREHHHPRPSVTMQRFTFHSRFRQVGESVSTFIAELRKLSGNTATSDRP